jgi:CheY-like chemotaxis protein
MSSGEMIMVVDDDADIREAVCLFLKGTGYRTAPWANGKQAIDWLLAAETPGLILLDLTMPVMDGYQFLSLKESQPALEDIPVVLMTAVPNCSQLMLRHHIFQFLPKPIWPSDLLDAVERAVRPAMQGPSVRAGSS